MRRRLMTALLLAVLASFAWAAAPAPQSSTIDGVTLTATLRIAGPLWGFDLADNTHTQDLADDPAKTARVFADGVSGDAALGWQGDPPGGHHRKGVLRFKPVSPAPRAIELRIERPGEATPRSFLWTLR
ncbi:MAG: hypothetical protein OEW21_02800 [Betaproteobacteria bacterium]|nr:hypothetical protein [Betaproteobacteria bacterium]